MFKLTCGGDGDICGGSKVLDKRSKACGHSGAWPPPTALNIVGTFQDISDADHPLPQHSTAKQKNVYVYQIKLCREHRNVSCKTAPKGFPIITPEFKLQRRYDIAIKSPLGSQLAMLPVPFFVSTQSHPRNGISSSPCISVPAAGERCTVAQARRPFVQPCRPSGSSFSITTRHVQGQK
jgi:hypothetical protein